MNDLTFWRIQELLGAFGAKGIELAFYGYRKQSERPFRVKGVTVQSFLFGNTELYLGYPCKTREWDLIDGAYEATKLGFTPLA